jgi:DEAD/DEAH box helicase domain-containing protein
LKICVFDLETRKLASDLALGEAGWSRLRRGEGGVSALAIYDSDANWCYLYDDHTLNEAALHLESADIVVGFNSIEFDLPIVEGIIGRKIFLKKHIDLKNATHEALQKCGHPLRKGENKLGAICDRTLGEHKLEDGALAPELADTGQWGRLFNYCAHDVKLTRDLYAHIKKEGGIISASNTFIPVPLPSDSD